MHYNDMCLGSSMVEQIWTVNKGSRSAQIRRPWHLLLTWKKEKRNDFCELSSSTVQSLLIYFLIKVLQMCPYPPTALPSPPTPPIGFGDLSPLSSLPVGAAGIPPPIFPDLRSKEVCMWSLQLGKLPSNSRAPRKKAFWFVLVPGRGRWGKGEACGLRPWDKWQLPRYLSWAQCNHMSSSFLEPRKTFYIRIDNIDFTKHTRFFIRDSSWIKERSILRGKEMPSFPNLNKKDIISTLNLRQNMSEKAAVNIHIYSFSFKP